MVESYSEITDEDLWFILNNPWSVSEYEWRLRDENNRKSMFKYIQELLQKADEDGYKRMWKTPEGEPISILGCYKMSEKKYTTILVSSTHYEKYAMNLSFEMRSILKEKAVKYKGHSLGMYTNSDHPHLFTWLRFLGFTYKPESDNADYKYFEIVAPK